MEMSTDYSSMLQLVRAESDSFHELLCLAVLTAERDPSYSLPCTDAAELKQCQ